MLENERPVWSRMPRAKGAGEPWTAVSLASDPKELRFDAPSASVLKGPGIHKISIL